MDGLLLAKEDCFRNGLVESGDVLQGGGLGVGCTDGHTGSSRGAGRSHVLFHYHMLSHYVRKCLNGF